MKRIDALAKRAPDNIEGALAVARAAIDAREFARARSALAPYLDAPTKRVALLMAALERAEGDEGRAREWLARAVNAAPDPAWTADGYVSDRWLPLSPVTGRLDAFEWRVPLTGMTERRAGDRVGPGLGHPGQARGRAARYTSRTTATHRWRRTVPPRHCTQACSRHSRRRIR